MYSSRVIMDSVFVLLKCFKFKSSSKDCIT